MPNPATSLTVLNREIIECRKCPRLVRYREEIAQSKRRAYRDQTYWGKPVPSFGDPNARLLIVALAPGAHGANRTGRAFTGDRSGDFLYRALHKGGFASQPTSVDRNDGLKLHDAWITAAGHCAPPDNKPAPDELRNCRGWLMQELNLMPQVKVVLALGRIACDAYLAVLKDEGEISRVGDYPFGHNVLFPLSPALLCSYHPSQQNTSTGRLTEPMMDEVIARAREIIKS